MRAEIARAVAQACVPLIGLALLATSVAASLVPASRAAAVEPMNPAHGVQRERPAGRRRGL